MNEHDARGYKALINVINVGRSSRPFAWNNIRSCLKKLLTSSYIVG